VSDLPLSTAFDSSAITRATYRPDEQILDIWYKGGDRYSYFGVPIEIYRALREAESAGEFVNFYVKPFPHEIEPRRKRFRPD
jgi:hypothetical protein